MHIETLGGKVSAKCYWYLVPSSVNSIRDGLIGVVPSVMQWHFGVLTSPPSISSKTSAAPVVASEAELMAWDMHQLECMRQLGQWKVMMECYSGQLTKVTFPFAFRALFVSLRKAARGT